MKSTGNKIGAGRALRDFRSISILWLAVVTVLLCLFGGSLSAAELPPKKRILVIHSRVGLRIWEMSFNTSLLTEVQGDLNMEVDVTQERLGLEHIATNDDLINIVEYLRYKSESMPVDLVIAVLPVANEFLFNHGETLYPGIPKIFMIPEIGDVMRITGIPNAVIVESIAESIMSNNVARIFSLLPNTEHLVVVSGNGIFDQSYLTRAKKAITSNETAGQVQGSYLVGLPLDELLKRVARLEKNTAIFFLTYEQDNANNVYRTIEVQTLLSEKSNAPMFGFVDSQFGRGIVGGNLSSAEAYAKISADIAMKLLNGESPASISPRPEELIDWYDWRQLKKWRIPESRLLSGSQIIYKPPSLWDEYRTAVIVAMIAFAVQSLLIIALILNLIRHRKAEQKLIKALEERERLISAIEHSKDTIVITDTEGIILYVNPAIENVTGYTQKEIIGQHTRFFKSGEHDDAFYNNLRNILAAKNTWSGHIKNKKKDGNLIIEDVSISPVFDSSGTVINYVEVKRDITEKIRMEEMLIQNEKMLSVGGLAAGMAHEINNPLAGIIQTVNVLSNRLERELDMSANIKAAEKAGTSMESIKHYLTYRNIPQMINTISESVL